MALFKHGDKVVYVGDLHRAELGGAEGTVIAQVRNCEVELVVDFGEDAWVLHESLLQRFSGYKDKGDKPEKHGEKKAKPGPEVQVIRRGRKSEEDSE